MFALIVAILCSGWRWSGVATYYPAEQFGGQPLYCDQFMAEELIYTEAMGAWVAVDVGMYESGAVRCGDELLLTFEDGRTLCARALDAGTFEGYYVTTWAELPIVVDLPEHLKPRGGSARVTMINLTAVERSMVDECNAKVSERGSLLFSCGAAGRHIRCWR